MHDDQLKKTLPKNFQFSQGSIQAYVDCPRYFQLFYLERLPWPAPETEPALENERYLNLGLKFHQMVQQYLLGIPGKRLSEISREDTTLEQWWQNYLDHRPFLAGYTQHNEISLSTPIGAYRLVAKYDLIALKSKVMIFDWKTSRKQPKREFVKNRLQTRVYPYVLVKAGTQLNQGNPIEPAQVEMVYWFSNFPTAAIKFFYSQEQFEEDEAYLEGVIAEIQALEGDGFPLTDNLKRCKFCIYRSLCDRGVGAGSLDELEEELEEREAFKEEFDFEQIAEIEF